MNASFPRPDNDVDAAWSGARLSRPADPWSDEVQLRLARLNTRRLEPALPDDNGFEDVVAEAELRVVEQEWIDAERRALAHELASAPSDPVALGEWLQRAAARATRISAEFRAWLANDAPLDVVRAVLAQEQTIEALTTDLLVFAQVRMPRAAKLALARRAESPATTRIATLADALGIVDGDAPLVREGFALSNLLVGVVANRRFAFHGVGALAAHVLSTPDRTETLGRALRRHGVAVADVTLGDDWSSWAREVFTPIFAEDFQRARALAEGAMLRLRAGARCWARYERMFR